MLGEYSRKAIRCFPPALSAVAGVSYGLYFPGRVGRRPCSRGGAKARWNMYTFGERAAGQRAQLYIYFSAPMSRGEA